MNDMRFRRHFPPRVVQETLQRSLQRETLQRSLRQARHHGEQLWLWGKRNPRILALSGGVVALTLVGGYAVSASGPGPSACPPVSEGEKPQFLLLVDPAPRVVAGSELKIHYDVCGLKSGSAYRGRMQLQPAGAKKTAAKRRPLAVTFRDQADGPATRRRQELNLGPTRPGAYSLELSVTDSQGRERKKIQKLVIKAD
jgi:hypothetical protein